MEVLNKSMEKEEGFTRSDNQAGIGLVVGEEERDKPNSQLAIRTVTSSQLPVTPRIHISLATEEKLREHDTRCGYFNSCKPDFLQRFANPKTYLIVISLCTIIQG